jgi:TRAP transporter 4TM/12TM fusion protein
MALVFWSPHRRQSTVPQILDIALGAFALAISFWMAFRFEDLGFALFTPGFEPVLLSALLLGLTIECCRRTAGIPMTLVVVTFVAYGYVAQFLPGAVAAPSISPKNYATYLVLSGDALYGQALTVVASIVTIFVLFGKAFEFAGGSDFIRDATLRLTAGKRGAPIKVSVVASGLLGSIVGSTTSNVLTVGSFTIPMMRKIGLPAHRAAAIEAVASTGGQLTPPVMGAAAFLMADIAGLPYSQVVVAALVPSLLYYFSLFVQADRLAARHRLSSGTVDGPQPELSLLRDGTIYLVPVIVVVSCLYAYEYAPQWAGLIGTAATAAIGLWRAKSLKRLLEMLVAAGRTTTPLVITAGAVGLMLGVVNSTGLAVTFTVAIGSAASHHLLLALAVTACAAYFLGMGLSTTAVYVLAGVLLAPSLVNLGVSTMAAHLFVFYTAMLSMITPPVAIACLVACGLAGSGFLKTTAFAMQFGWIKFVLPFLFVYSPELLLDGEPLEIAATIVAIATAIVLVASASSGFDRDKISTAMRLAYLAYAIFLIVPWAPAPVRALASIPTIFWLNRFRFRTLDQIGGRRAEKS